MEPQVSNTPPVSNISNELPPPAMKVSSFFLSFLLVIILLGITTSVLSILYPRQEAEEVQVVVDSMEGWKTYRSEEYGFEFKYPKDMVIEEISQTDDFWVNLNSSTEKPVVSFHPKQGCDDGYVKQFVLSEDCSISYFKYDYYKSNPLKFIKGVYFNEVVLNKISGFQIATCNVGCSLQTFFQNKDTSLFVVSGGITDDMEYVGDKFFLKSNSKYSQILSTFKLLNKPLSISDYSKPFQKGEADYYGTLNVSGYIEIINGVCDPKMDGDIPCTQLTYYKSAVFHVVGSDSELFLSWLKDIYQNSLVESDKISLGCYDENKNVISYINFGDDGVIKDEIKGNDLSSIFSSTRSSPVKIQMVKSYVSSGKGAPLCTSVFRDYKIVK